MTTQQRSELQQLKKSALEGMMRYMKYGGADNEKDPDYDPEFDAGYTQKHIDRCGKILDAYLGGVEGLRATSADEKILSSAKKAVLSLNSLNDQCDGSLIETDQREQICELMIVAAKYAGLTLGGDFTEEWRQW